MNAVDRVVTLILETCGDSVLGVYLHGSAVAGGLRPDSDLDLLAVTQRSLTQDERQALVRELLCVSGRRATEGPARPVELTSVVLGDISPWRHPSNRDFQYGEWLRDDFEAGTLPEPERDPDLGLLLRAVTTNGLALHGPDPAKLLTDVPDQALRRAITDSLPALLDDLEGDERNVLLTLAPMIVILETGEIVPKDEAADIVAPVLPEEVRAPLETARAAYLGELADDWTTADARESAAACATWLALLVDQSAGA